MPLNCSNCGEPVGGKFCSSCGQQLESRRGPIGSLLREALVEALSLDGRNLRTARALFVPGRLTEAFLAGRRARYSTPIQLYLLCSLLFFVTASIVGPDAADYDVYLDGKLVGEQPASAERPDLGLSTVDPSSRLAGWLESAFEPKRERFRNMSAQELLDGLFASLERSLPNCLILFVPFLALALKLLYRRSDLLYYDHLIFSLHFQSFLFLLLVAVRALGWTGMAFLQPSVGTYLLAIAIGIPFYLLFALRRVYRQAWMVTIAKTAILLVLYLIIFGIVTTVTSMVVLWGI